MKHRAARLSNVRWKLAGINFFDTADVYSLGVSEEVTGHALHDLAERDEKVELVETYLFYHCEH